MSVDYELTGKVAIITGAGRGVGAAIALALAKQGAAVVVSDIDDKLASQVANQARSYGSEAIALQANVAKRSEVQELVDVVLAKFGRIDILVNNAGISPKKNGHKVSVLDMDPDEWEKVLDINLKGVFHFSQLCARVMVQQRSGKIINISSAAGRTYIPVAGAHYITSKTGIIGLTRALAGELAPFGINVNALAPGRIETEMMHAVSDEENRVCRAGTPVGRIGQPEDVANAVLFLASDRNSYITGTVLGIDGGKYMV